MNNAAKKYFFLYLKTGGGHLAPARSIAQYISKNHSKNVDPVLVDGLAEATSFARYIIEDGYRLLQAKAKWYYELLYATNKFPPIGYFNVAMANFFIKPYIRKRITQERPSKIVIFHFFLITPVYQVLRELGWNIPVITVITDPFTAHPLWFQKKAQQFIVFSDRLKKYCFTRGFSEQDIRTFPFIIDEKFTTSLSSTNVSEFKSRHGLDEKKKTILIMGGGDGIPHGKQIIQNLLSASLPLQMVIVCGKNQELYAQALELQKKDPNLKVFGFVDFVYELLTISDIVITKCGASTIMEILLMKKIPVIIDYLWEQELGNMEFVRDNKLGIFERDINKISDIIRSLISQNGHYETYRKNIEAMYLNNGTKDVSEYLLTL